MIINYIVAHILLIYNEKSQREIVSFYNKIAENLPFTERKFYTVDPIVSENECQLGGVNTLNQIYRERIIYNKTFLFIYYYL